jgi:transcription initiation factor IIE alpha subunit
MHDIDMLFSHAMYHAGLCPVVGGVLPAVLLAEVCELLHETEGQGAALLTPSEIARHTGLTEREQRKAQRALATRGIISIRTKEGQQYVRLHLETFETVWRAYYAQPLETSTPLRAWAC